MVDTTRLPVAADWSCKLVVVVVDLGEAACSQIIVWTGAPRPRGAPHWAPARSQLDSRLRDEGKQCRGRDQVERKSRPRNCDDYAL